MVWTTSSNGWRENGCQEHAFDTNFIGVGEKGMQCVLYGKYSLWKKPFSRLRVSVPRDRFLLEVPKIHHIGGGTTPGFVREDFGQDFSRFERDDLDEHVCFWSFFLLVLVFSFKRSQYIDLYPPVCHLFETPLRSCSMRRARCLGFFPPQ